MQILRYFKSKYLLFFFGTQGFSARVTAKTELKLQRYNGVLIDQNTKLRDEEKPEGQRVYIHELRPYSSEARHVYQVTDLAYGSSFGPTAQSASDCDTRVTSAR